jgi:hypothetical protein
MGNHLKGICVQGVPAKKCAPIDFSSRMQILIMIDLQLAS